MRWIKDVTEAEWTAAITPDGNVRLTRRVVKPPYREDGEPREEYESYEFSKLCALGVSAVLTNAAKADLAVEKG